MSKRGVKKILKIILIILLVMFTVAEAVVGIRQLIKYHYNKTHWITITFYDECEYGVIKTPIVKKIHPGERVEFPDIIKELPNGDGYLGWIGCYYEDGEESERGVRVDEKFYESMDIYPFYSSSYAPENVYDGIEYYEKLYNTKK